MPLNIDPQGYAKSVATSIPLYGGQGGAGGRGLTSGLNPLLKRIIAMRERQAQAELQMMRREREEDREFEREMRTREKQERESRERSERGRRRLAEGPLHQDPASQRMLDLRKAAQTLGIMQQGAGGGDPNIIRGTTEQMGMASPYLAALGGLGLGTGGTSAGPMPTRTPSIGQIRARGGGETGVTGPRFTRSMNAPFVSGGGGFQDVTGLADLARQQGGGEGARSFSNYPGGTGYDPRFAGPGEYDPNFMGPIPGGSSRRSYKEGTPLPKLSGRESWGRPLESYQGGTPWGEAFGSRPEMQEALGQFQQGWFGEGGGGEDPYKKLSAAGYGYGEAENFLANRPDIRAQQGTKIEYASPQQQAMAQNLQKQGGIGQVDPNYQSKYRQAWQDFQGNWGGGAGAGPPGGTPAGAPGTGGAVPGPPRRGSGGLTPAQQFQQARQGLPQFGGPGGAPSPELAKFKPTPRGAPTGAPPSMATGGGVPKTGTYKLHKGEMVIPTKDVDPELVTYLTRKKIYDRAYKKTGGTPLGDYQEGTLDDLFKLAEGGDTPAFREILRSQGMSDKEIDRTIYQATRGEKGKLFKTSQKAKNMRDFLGGAIPPERSLIPSPAPRAMVPPIKGPGIRDIPRGLIGTGDDIVRASRKLPGWLKTLGVAGGVGLGAYGLSQMEPSEEGEIPEPPGGPPSTALVPESLADMPEAIGGRLREVMSGLTEPIVKGAGGFFKGLTGVGEGEPAPSTDEAAQTPGTQAIQDLAGTLGGPGAEEFPEGSYEAAAARVKAEDYGTPERPLVLKGELSDIEQAQRDVESLPMYQEAKRKSYAAQKEANAIYSMLAKEGRAMNPEVYDDLAKEADRKMKLSKSFDAVLERQEKSSQAMLMTSEKATQALIKELTKQQAIGTRQQALQELKDQGNFTRTAMRGFASSLPGLYRAAASGSPGDRTRAQQEIAQVFKIIASFLEANAETSEERDTYRAFSDASETHAEEFSNLEIEQAMTMIEALRKRFSAAGELQGLMGGQ